MFTPHISSDHAVAYLLQSCRDNDKYASITFFNHLHPGLKSLIIVDLCHLSAINCSDRDWIRTHSFDDLSRVAGSVSKAVIFAFNSLSENHKLDVLKSDCSLAGIVSNPSNQEKLRGILSIDRLTTALYALRIFPPADQNMLLNTFLRTPRLVRYVRDKALLCQILDRKGAALEFVCEPFRSDKDLVLRAISQNEESFSFASESLRKDVDFVLAAVAIKANVIKYAHESVQKNKHILIAAISEKPEIFFDEACKNFWNDKEFVIAALDSVKPDSYYLAENVLKDSEDLIKNDRDFVKRIVSKYPFVLKDLDQSLKDDKEIVMLSVTNVGACLQFASSRLQGDKEIVLAAVTQNGLALQYASEALKDDKDVIHSALHRESQLTVGYFWNSFLQYASDRLKNDIDIVSRSVDQNKNSLKFAGIQIQRAFVERDFEFIVHACEALTSDVQFLSECLKKQPSYLFKLKSKCLFDAEKQKIIISALLRECLQDVEELHLADALQKNILEYKNDEIQAFLVHQLLHLSKESFVKILTGESAFTPSQRKDLIHILVVIHALPISEEKKHKITSLLKKHYLPLFKDNLKKNPLLKLFLHLFQSRIDHEVKYEKIIIALENNKGKELMNTIYVLCALMESSSDRLADLSVDQISSACLPKILFHNFQVQGMLPEGDEALSKAVDVFLHYRASGALLSYASLFINHEEMKKAIFRFTRSVLAGTFLKERYDDSPNIKRLSQEHKLRWMKPIEKEDLAKIKEAGDIDMRKFLFQKLVRDRHGKDLFSGVCLYLENKNLEDSKLSPVERAVIDLLSMKLSDLPVALQKIAILLKDPAYEHLEFCHDIHGLIDQLQPKDHQGKLILVDSDDPEDLFLCGSEVTGSCQRVDGDPELNKCLMGYVLDGKVRLLAVKNSHGNILARSILKVLFDENQQPILLFEDVYGDERYEIALKDFALKKAKATGLRIIVGGVDQHLESFGNVAPYEYEDEDCGVTNGVYTINGLDHESDVESSDG